MRWLTQALLALKYIHDKHILHRDLKCSNFFLTKSGNLKVGDFGIARVLSCTAAFAKTQVGTPYYLSPEVCQGKPYSWSSDIWAMGCVLFELCALRVPFDAPNMASLVQKILRSPVPTVPCTYSDGVRQLCGDMLQRNPDRRPGAGDILQKPIIQSMVRKLLDEAQQQDSSKSSQGGQRPSSVDRNYPMHGGGVVATPMQQGIRTGHREQSPGFPPSRGVSPMRRVSPEPSSGPPRFSRGGTPARSASPRGARPPGIPLPRANSPSVGGDGPSGAQHRELSRDRNGAIAAAPIARQAGLAIIGPSA